MAGTLGELVVDCVAIVEAAAAWPPQDAETIMEKGASQLSAAAR